MLKLKIKRFIFKVMKKEFKNESIEKPLFISNMPIKKRGKFITNVLTKDILTLKVRIPIGSVVFIDEISAIVNQFNRNLDECQYHLNEFCQFFRHYVQGYLILNAQAESEIVKQIRVKLNSYYICMNFKKFLWFYKCDLLHRLCTGGDDVNTTDFYDENVRRTFGILRKNYDTHYLSERYKKVKNLYDSELKHNSFKVNEIIRFKDYESRCD